MMPLTQLIAQHPQGMLNPWFYALMAEFRSEKMTWKEVMFPKVQSRTPVLQLDVAVWPLKLMHQDAYGKYFLYQPFA